MNIHTDEVAARKAGFRAPIAGGEQTYALMANFLLDSFGIDFLRGGRLEAALVKPVFYGDTLTMNARTIDDAAQLQLEVWTENQLGERVLIGTARVPKRSHERGTATAPSTQHAARRQRTARRFGGKHYHM